MEPKSGSSYWISFIVGIPKASFYEEIPPSFLVNCMSYSIRGRNDSGSQ